MFGSSGSGGFSNEDFGFTDRMFGTGGFGDTGMDFGTTDVSGYIADNTNVPYVSMMDELGIKTNVESGLLAATTW